jgi:hypothetical protein
MGRCIAGKRGTFTLSLILAGTLLCPGWTKHGIAIADQKAETAAPQEERGAAAAEYHTPLAGKPLHTVFMGKSVDIPAMDRSRVTALTLGGVFYTPKQGDTFATPIGSLFLKRV